MHPLDLLLTLAAGLSAALVFGYVTHRLGLSPIVGYLIAGIAVGPHTPGYVANQTLAQQLAEIGVVLLMFGVGMHFQLRELWAVRRVAIPGALGQVVATVALGALVAVAFGLDATAGLVLGAALSVASTVVLMRVLADRRDLHTPVGHVAIGWSVVQDVITVVVLVVLPALFGTTEPSAGAVTLAVGIALAKLAGLAVLMYFAGGRVIPWLLERVAATRSRELFTLTVLVLALGIAVGSALLFGVSMALGAFLAGMVVGRSEFSLRAASEALPMRDAFAVLFFVSIGMLFHPADLLAAPGLALAVFAVVVVGKTAAALVILYLLRYPPRMAFAAAIALAQIGEFSFVLTLLGIQLGVVPAATMNSVVAAAIFSITISPLLYRAADGYAEWSERRERKRLRAGANDVAPAAEPADRADRGDAERPRPAVRHRAIVVGYGPVGRTVTRLLEENDIETVVIELDLAAVRRRREERGPGAAIYGDARQRETLKNAGVAQAESLVLSASGLEHSADVIRMARDLNPEILVLARSAYLREVPPLQTAGAEQVFSGEGEIAIAFTVAILRGLGATDEQIDRERARVHAELIEHATGGATAPPAPLA